MNERDDKENESVGFIITAIIINDWAGHVKAAVVLQVKPDVTCN